MADVIQALADSLNRDMEAINHIAQNLANVNTPGYKTSQLITTQTDFSKSMPGVVSVPKINVQTSTVHNFKPGNIQQSKRALDIAIVGDAFLKVAANGKVLMSRNGSMHLNEDGVLVSSNGFPILTDAGELALNTAEGLKIDKEGNIYQYGNRLAQLDLISYKNPSAVVLVGSGLLYTPEQNLQPAEDWIIHQGFIEKSNVNTSQEMVRMMETSKHFQSVQKALSTYDQAIGSGITKIGQ
jgi:flagellar basal-body rod protein FlgF